MAKTKDAPKSAKTLKEADRATLKKVMMLVGKDGWEMKKGVDYVDAEDKKQKLVAKLRTELARFEDGYTYPITDISLIGYFNLTKSELGWTRPTSRSRKGSGDSEAGEGTGGEVTLTEAKRAMALADSLGGWKSVATALATLNKIEDQFGSLDRFREVLTAVATFRDDKDSLRTLMGVQ